MALMQRLPDGKIQMVFGEGLGYILDETTAWDDLNAIMDDPDLPEPETVSAAAAGIVEPGEAINFIESLTTEIYGPMVGKLFKTAAVGGKHLITKAKGRGNE